jgi:uncharacterized protein (DUF433 family)
LKQILCVAIMTQRSSNSRDARNRPTYGLSEAAHYLRVNRSTFRTWLSDSRRTATGEVRPKSFVIRTPTGRAGDLSFINLVEAFVLSSIRYKHGVSLQKIRAALDYVERTLKISHPLASARFLTDGTDLFVEKYGELISASESGQTAMRAMLMSHLQRVEHDEAGMAVRLYPWTRTGNPDEPRTVVIDPQVAFGRPCVAGTGVPTALVAERYKAGESMDELAEDYGLSRSQVEEAVRCELDQAA